MKERIIGAVVLVIFAVLVVPVFLDGPPEQGAVVTERVLLPGQDEQKTQTVVLERDRTEPVPAANATQPETPQAEVQEEPEQEAVRSPEPSSSTPKPLEKPAEKPVEKPIEAKPKDEPAASSTGMWAVQLGSFSNKDNAERLAADLRKQGYAAFLSQLDTASGALHRVRIGPMKDRDAAEQMVARLQKAGHSGQAVPHP